MKILKYILLICIAVLTLQSCDKVQGLLGDNSTEQSADESSKRSLNDSSAINAAFDSLINANDSVVKKLAETVKNLESEVDVAKQSQNKLEKEVEKIKSGTISIKKQFVYLALYTIVLIAVVVFIVLRLTMRKEKIEEYVEDKLHDFNVDLSNRLQHSLPQSSQNNVWKYDQINSAIRQINSDIAQLKNWLSALQTQKETPANTPTAKLLPNNPKTSVFYMEKSGICNKDMFDDAQKKIVATESSLYKFTLKDQTEAEYEFAPLAIQMQKQAFYNHDIYINPVCDYDCRNQNGTVKRIAGIVKLENGVWKVVKRARITIE